MDNNFYTPNDTADISVEAEQTSVPENEQEIISEAEQTAVPETEQSAVPEAAEKKESDGFKGKLVSQIFDIADVFISAIIMILIVFTFVFRFVGVVGTSMVNTLQENDWLAITATTTKVDRGDIVVITQPNYFNEPIIKRVVGLPGETVDLDVENQQVLINGTPLEENYTSSPLKLEDLGSHFEVPEGCVFVMGDNRSGSTDSRSVMVGMIDEDYILGKVVFRLLPWGNFKVD
ncbi:MAG: signal peptidase I [Clostridiales bacterium]|nr:signal peptidase I [Clostridiales bacterium]